MSINNPPPSRPARQDVTCILDLKPQPISKVKGHGSKDRGLWSPGQKSQVKGHSSNDMGQRSQEKANESNVVGHRLRVKGHG